MAMKKILTDLHSHTTFSYDASGEMEEMLATARALGIQYYGVSEHFDFDAQVNGIDLPRLNPPQPHEFYFQTARRFQKEYEGVMRVLVGAEFGYTDNPEALAMYQAFVQKYQPDFVIQSIHTIPSGDYAFQNVYVDEQGKVRDQREVYEEYLGLIRRSLDVAFDFDIVGHIGYCTRYAPYEDRRLRWCDYAKQLDDILQTIIAKGKILEVNSSNKGGVSLSLPDRDIVERYYELGGRNISFGSDAHFPSRIMENREKVMDFLRAVGFEYLTIPCRKEHIQVEI